MTFFELFLIGIGLSMDAFAVSICKGLSMQKIDKKYTLCIGLFFGGFQALMPLAGYLLGSRFSGYIERFDHWIAFVRRYNFLLPAPARYNARNRPH